MKAAVLHRFGESPKFGDFPEPVPEGDGQLLVRVRSASLKNIDRARASGKHYASYERLPTVVGLDGVALLPDGSRVFAQGITGMMAEKALVDKGRCTLLPGGVDDATGAALPNAVMGAGLALQYRGRIRPGETVLINGATGVTGNMAVQLARYFKAGLIIATGRNPDSLALLKSRGAHVCLPLGDDLSDRLRKIHQERGIDLVIDYLWGKPAEMVLYALRGDGLDANKPQVRFVTVGSMAGETIQLASGILRSAPIEVIGSGFGSVAADVMDKMSSEILPEMLRLAAEGGLVIDTVTAPLEEIEAAWGRQVPGGKRMVITMPL